MWRFWFLLAILLLVGAIGYFSIILQGPENAWAKQIFETVLCEDPEEIVQWLGNYVRDSDGTGGGRETAYYCEDSEGQQRDVTLAAIGLIGGGFAIPLVLSIIFMMLGAGGMIANRMKTATSNPFNLVGGTATWNSLTQPQQSTVSVIDMRDGSYQGGEIPPEKLAQIKQIMSQMGFDNFFENSGGNSLTERLQQVEDAHQQGMINQAEYQRLRQAILDDVAD